MTTVRKHEYDDSGIVEEEVAITTGNKEFVVVSVGGSLQVYEREVGFKHPHTRHE